MANKLENIIQHALKTFKKPVRRCSGCSQSDLSELRSLADEVIAEDIKKLEHLIKNAKLKDFLQIKKTSLDYLSVYEDDSISVGVFLLKQDAKLPIHDHPEMHGIIKVLEGVLRITSYTVVEVDKTQGPLSNDMHYPFPLNVIKHPELILGKSDPSCLLTPSEKNIHEVECVEGPAAFLDILSPPYEEGEENAPRSCHFFKEESQSTPSSSTANPPPSGTANRPSSSTANPPSGSTTNASSSGTANRPSSGTASPPSGGSANRPSSGNADSDDDDDDDDEGPSLPGNIFQLAETSSTPWRPGGPPPQWTFLYATPIIKCASKGCTHQE